MALLSHLQHCISCENKASPAGLLQIRVAGKLTLLPGIFEDRAHLEG